MIEFIYYILSRIFPETEPYDTIHKSRNLYVKELDIALIFDDNIENYPSTNNVYIIHEEETAPNIKYMNYYVDDISYDEAIRVLDDISHVFKTAELNPIAYKEANTYYHHSINKYNEKYRQTVIEYMTASDENIYPVNEYKGLMLRNWLEMQEDGYSIDYIYNGYKAKVVNSSSCQSTWGYNYTVMRKYQAVNKTKRITHDACIDGINIGVWISEQRTAYREGYIQPQRVKLIEETGISLNWFKDAWEENYELLKEYKKEYGNINIEKREKYRGKPLGLWCQRQRNARSMDKQRLTKERIDKLNKIGFDWNPLETEWNRRYEQYKRYIGQNEGNAYIPRRRDFEGEHLGAWVETQRKERDKGNMSNERLQMMKLLNPDF